MKTNFEKFFKWGFIVSLIMVALAMLLKLGTLIRYLDAVAVVFGILLAVFTLADLLGFYKDNTKKTPNQTTSSETKN